VLLKWGEHSNDVQFILQWSPLDSTSSSNKSGQLQSGKFHTSGGGVESSCSDNSSSHSPSPLSKPISTPFTGAASNLSSGVNNSSALSPLSQANGPGSKKSTATGSLSSNVSSESRVGNSPYSQSGPEGPMNASHAPEHLVNSEVLKLSKINGGGIGRSSTRQVGSDTSTPYTMNSSSSGLNGKAMDNMIPSIQSIGKLVDPKLTTPPPYREPPSPACHPTPPLASPTPGMSSPGIKSLPPYREPPPPNVSHGQPFMNKPSGGGAPPPHLVPSSLTMKANQQPSGFGIHSVHQCVTNSGMTDAAIGSGYGVFNHKDSSKFSQVNSNPSPQQDSISSLSSSTDVSETWKNKVLLKTSFDIDIS
jgi:hypothetical protein